jgi:hypothetical protein
VRHRVRDLLSFGVNRVNVAFRNYAMFGCAPRVALRDARAIRRDALPRRSRTETVHGE